MVQGVVCAGGLYAIRTEAQLATSSAGTAAGVLDATNRGQIWTHGWKQSMRKKRWLTHSRVQNLAGRTLTKEGQARARADAQALDEALVPDSRCVGGVGRATNGG